MKLRTSFLTRCLALVMALVLVVSGSNLGVVLQAFAAEGTQTSVSAGKLVADNYELTAAEEALLSSGMLVGDTYSYTAPTDSELITVDTENATITAEKSGEWTPTTAYIVANGETVETITLVNGTGSYDPAVGNAFSVKVRYERTQEVSADVQQTLLNAAAWLKQGVKITDDVSAQSGNLYILEQAMPQLVELATTDIAIGNTGMTANLNEEGKAAINALNAQMTANGGNLNLSVMVAEYDAGAKTGYLMTKGTQMQAEIDELLKSLAVISKALNDLSGNLAGFIEYGFIDAATGELIKTLNGVVNNLKTAMDTVAQDPWTAANMGTGLVNAAANYETLDTLVAALGETTAAPAVKNPLLMAETTIQKNMSMFNVTVKVTLETVEDNEVGARETAIAVLTLAEGASAEEIVAAVEAAGIEKAALEAWAGVYVAEHFERSESDLPEGGLYADLEYTITYSPKNYTVTFTYADTIVVPYGYQVTLPEHSDASQAYDYTVNGVAYAQGEVVPITGNTTIDRTSGKAYTSTNLYAVIADNYGNDVAEAILTSGALKNNSVISVRKPDPADAASLLTLVDGELTAKDYDAAYQGLNWNPYTYGAEGTENSFTGNTASWTGESAKVQYILKLTNFSVEEVQAVLDLAVTLKAEAADQKATLDAFMANKTTMGQLDKTKLGALNGVIDVTDFTPGDNTDTDADNEEMRTYFKGLVSGIIANNVASNNYLKIYNMLGEYETEGLKYYYENYSAFIAEIETLAGYLHGMLEDEEKVKALEIMVTAAGYPEYAEKIADLESKLAKVLEDLSAPNAAIDLNSANLGKLITALTAKGDVVTTNADYAYLLSETLTVLDESQVMVQVIINTTKGGATVTSAPMDKGAVLTQAIINDLKAKVDAEAAKLLGENVKFYTLTVSNPLEALVGIELNENINIYHTYAPTEYKAVIEGETDQIVTIEDLEIKLPKHPTQGWDYEYTIDGVSGITSTTYTFTVEQLGRLFASGSYTITRKAVNTAETKLEEFVNKLNEAVGDKKFNLVTENGAYTGIVGDIATEDMMNFVMGLVNGGYSYVGLNDEGLLYLNAENTLEISLQTLINAVLADEDFNNDTIVGLSENGKGKLLTAKLQLGNDASDLSYTNLSFTLNLTTVPDALTSQASLLKAISNYIKFQSVDGELAVSVNLPDKAYGAYAAALIATGNVDKTDVNDLTQDVAINFVYDYFTAITGSEADMISFTNTLKILGLGKDLSGYNSYYNPAVDALNDYVTVTISDAGAAVDIAAPGQGAIDTLLKLMKIDTASISQYLGMIKEYKAGGQLTASADATVKNVDKTYYALIVDAQADGVTNKFEAPSSVAALQEQTSTLAGYSAIILLDDVKGDLTISGTTVLDLNGKSVSGNINAAGTLYIIDSTMDTYNAGTVGSVSGNAVIIGGNYNADVSSYLKDGYYMDGTTVRNALYYITDENGNVAFHLNGDVYQDEHVSKYIPNPKALAIDIAADLVLNYAYSAKLSVEGNDLIGIDVDDLLGIYDDHNASGLVKTLLDCVTIGEAGYENNVGFEAVVNLILDDVIDFGAISGALANNTALATYGVTTEPWTIELEHIADGDYVTVNVGSNADLAKDFNVALVVESKYNDTLAALTGELANIVENRTDLEIDIPTPTYSDKTLTVVGAGKAEVYVDMSQNSDYAAMIGVILAYGNADKRAAVAEAINSDNLTALKAVVDNTTVAELFTALKVMSRNVDFAAMAQTVGVTVDVTSAAELEDLYHLALCASGKALEELEITGRSSKLGGLYNEETGYYELTKEDMFKDAELSARGYTARIELTADVLSLNVKLFAEIEEETCMIGDVNHDNVIDTTDAVLIERYLAEFDTPVFCFRGANVNGDDVVDTTDATLMRQYLAEMIDKFPAE